MVVRQRVVRFQQRSSRRGALGSYTLGMSGNQDRAERARAFVGRVYDQAEGMIEGRLQTLADEPSKPGDALGAQRFFRAVESAVRAAKLAASLVIPIGRAPSDHSNEDEMRDRDDSPENLERIRAELESRLTELDAALEAKGLSVEPGRWPTARAGREPVQSS